MFFRNNKVNILRYLPGFLQSDVDFKNVADASSAEHETIRLLIQDIFNQFFIETATWGLDGYERILAITPKASDTYEIRRRRILLKYQSNQTSTVEFLRLLVKRYATSAATVRVVEFNSQSSFSIITEGGSIIDIAGMFEAIDIYKPAHLTCLLRYERPVYMSLSIGNVIRTGRNIKVRAVNQFSLNKVDGISTYGFAIRTAKQTTIKAVV